jgi:hypothetical protein
MIMLGDTKAARNMLGSLVARGSTPAIKTAARTYLGVAAQVELASAGGAEAPTPARPPEVIDEPVSPVPLDPATSSAAAGAEARRTAATANVEQLLLRTVLDGEVRIFGAMTHIDCSTDGTRLVVQMTAGAVRVRGGTLDTIDFVSYRSDIAGGIICGPQPQAPPVLVTYRPEPQDGTVGEVVIVEVVPVSYKPPAR